MCLLVGGKLDGVLRTRMWDTEPAGDGQVGSLDHSVYEQVSADV